MPGLLQQDKNIFQHKTKITPLWTKFVFNPTRPIPGQVNHLIQNVALSIVISVRQRACEVHAFIHRVLRMLLHRYDGFTKTSYQNHNMQMTEHKGHGSKPRT